MSQPENEKVYSLGDYVAVRSETNDWCVMSEINDLSKEVKFKFITSLNWPFLQFCLQKSDRHFLIIGLLWQQIDETFLESLYIHSNSLKVSLSCC